MPAAQIERLEPTWRTLVASILPTAHRAQFCPSAMLGSVVDFAALRLAVEPIVMAKGIATHKELPELCHRLGMPPPTETGSLRERIQQSFSAVSDRDIPLVAQRCLEQLRPLQSERHAIQDLLWADDIGPTVSKRVRRDIARSIAAEDLYAEGGWGHFDALISHLFMVHDDLAAFGVFFGQPDRSLRAEIERHVHRNQGDWSTDYLFGRLGVFDCANPRFRRFLEGLASPEVCPNEEAQRRFVETMNKNLRASGAELRETGHRDGYPTFTLVSLSNPPTGRPKNLIFASFEKPDLRFRDAINNDIEIVTNADKVLIYDRPFGRDGLRWVDLQAWWAEERNQPNDDAAKKSLYRRLKEAMPANSPPQLLFFESFFSTYRERFPHLPALLPEVWLHWDPQAVADRGVEALARFRMDFLMLLPDGVRVVIEIDGKQHYTDKYGRPSPAQYGAMVAADRELRFAGYDLFRFGGAELHEATGVARVQEFFHLLFKRHGIKP